MADIFISYARADRDKIEKLAAALTSEGYSVWWDRHIESGAEFSADIERELEAAKAVIVCWSEEGAKSRWVKDEANVATEAGKLLSITLDDNPPPIGFRQYHAVNFSDWKGARDAASFIDLARTIKAKVGMRDDEQASPDVQGASTPAMVSAEKRKPAGAGPVSLLHLHKTHPKIWAAAVAALLAIIALSYFMSHRETGGAGDGAVAAGAQNVDRSKSIAVLPFADFSPSNDQEWFSDGLTEEILNSLTRTPDLLVASRTSSFRYKDTKEDIPMIAKRLGVEHVLEGSVRRAGDKLRVTVQLIRASDGFHLWSENYDRTADDVIAIQEDIAIEIATALKTAMDPQALAAMAQAGTRSVEAYEAYLEGLALRTQLEASGDFDALDRANAAFEHARSIDPNFSNAHFYAAEFLWANLTPIILGTAGPAQATQDLQKYLERIDLAIATEQNEHVQLRYNAEKAAALFRLNDATGYYEDYLRAYPLDIEAWGALADIYVATGDFPRSGDAAEKMLEISGDVVSQLSNAISAFVWVKQYDKAARIGQHALSLNPDHVNVLYQTHRALLWAGAVDDARLLTPRLYNSQMGEVPQFTVKIRQACADGDRALAEDLADRMLAFGDEAIAPKWYTLKLLGREDEALKMLAPYDRPSPPILLNAWLIFPYFDVTKFPNLNAALKRQGVTRAPAINIPFACPPAEEGR